ncbi:type II toxin-antitoxin system RelE/ParE family toxin [Acerihabitans sp. TG2]|uniref:type II toxin-antitoxin system RelE/ParE family toxin n=1 Tax=Acerihabitans sp. TG2 TaxID=3096008 RepID=UPI002B23BDD6|nr:type II toxin-antitoxin system RelE/ParE family toxin [Acerihabitans sp. TG2]MEA9392076.1 type II toxin-antitoxin system RelE/ParE family toxin [Acerihabitans sp. TG2]
MWLIETTDRFDRWFSTSNDSNRASILAALIVLREKGPNLSRPYADTVQGSRYSNMKELRVQSRGDPIRAFFAFDPCRTGILLCAGNKVGNEKRFYDVMIPVADQEFTHYLKKVERKD